MLFYIYPSLEARIETAFCLREEKKNTQNKFFFVNNDLLYICRSDRRLYLKTGKEIYYYKIYQKFRMCVCVSVCTFSVLSQLSSKNGCRIYVDIMTGGKLSSLLFLVLFIGQFFYPTGGERMG